MKLPARFGLLLLSISVAAWLRMFDNPLSMQSWSNLLGQPLVKWIGALIGSPLFELSQNWLGHLIGVGMYMLVALLRHDRLSRPAALLLGLLIGGGVQVLSVLARYQSVDTFLKLLLIYSLTGLLGGGLYHSWIVAKQPALTPLS